MKGTRTSNSSERYILQRKSDGLYYQKLNRRGKWTSDITKAKHYIQKGAARNVTSGLLVIPSWWLHSWDERKKMYKKNFEENYRVITVTVTVEI